MHDVQPVLKKPDQRRGDGQRLPFAPEGNCQRDGETNWLMVPPYGSSRWLNKTMIG